MKLESLEIENFFRIREANIDLAGAPIHYFCGDNEAGKSTIKDAVRFVMVGDSPRVKLKKDFKQLLSDGAKKGFVKLQADGIQMSRNLPSGESANKQFDNISDAARTAARIALGAQAFTDMDPDKRRAMLFSLTAAKTDPEAIADRMLKEEVPKPIVDRLKILLKGSIDAAHIAARTEVSTVRAKWEQATGDRWGEKKAETWEAEKPTASKSVIEAAADVDGLRADVAALDARLLESAKAIGTAEAQVTQLESLEAQLKRLDDFVHNKGTLQRDLDGIREEIAEHEEALRVANELIERAEEATHNLTCPGCDAVLKLENGDLTYADPNSQNFAVDEERRTELLAQRTAAQAKLDKLRPEATTKEKRLDAVARDAELRAKITADMKDLATPAKLRELQDADTLVKGERTDFSEQLRVVEDYLRRKERAEQATKTAGELFLSFKAWKKAEDLLAPDGLPAEILAEALGDFNRRLLTSAHLAGWLAPQLNKDMELIREASDDENERSFGSLSVSAQWRVSAIVADAISTIAGIRLLVLDGWDVLDMTGRVQLLKWLTALAQTDYDTILAMATLKQPLSAELAGASAKVHWVQDGRVSS